MHVTYTKNDTGSVTTLEGKDVEELISKVDVSAECKSKLIAANKERKLDIHDFAMFLLSEASCQVLEIQMGEAVKLDAPTTGVATIGSLEQPMPGGINWVDLVFNDHDV